MLPKTYGMPWRLRALVAALVAAEALHVGAEEVGSSASSGGGAIALGASIPAPAIETGSSASGEADVLALKTATRLVADRKDVDPPPAFIQGLKMSGETGRLVVIEGEAELRKRGTNIKADTITYLPVEDRLTANGHVRVYRQGDLFSGTALDLKLDEQTGYFLNADYLLANNRARGSAAKMDFLGKDNYRADDAVYTTCGPGNDDWFLKVKELKLDYGRDAGEVSGAELHFMGAHVLTIPTSLSFSLNDRRKSGLLTPTFGTTIQSGQEMSVPFYWNLAPNRDVTITPRFMTKRGLQTNVAGRYIGEAYQGEVRGEWLPNDKITGSNRSGFSLLHRQMFGGGWGGNLNINRVSDDTYFTDLSSRISQTSARTLIREGNLYYGSPFFSVNTRVQSYQTLQDPLSPIVRPYHRLPQISLVSRQYDLGGFDVNLQGELTRFSHPTDVMGNRIIANPSISYPMLSSAGFLTPKLFFHSTHYKLQQVTPGGAETILRNVPGFSLDSGLVFEKPSEYFGQKYTQTLEPRAYYLRIPRRDQSRIPVFDTGIADLNNSQIFTDNVYSGSDRIADANQVTLGLTSRLLGTEKGAERIRITLAQRFYFTDQSVTLPGETPRTDRSSDFLASVSGEILPKLILDTGLQYNPSRNEYQRVTAGVRWTPEPGKTLSAAYRYRRDVIGQVDFASQWKIADNWYGVGRYNFSFMEGRLVEALGGFEYDGGCWVGRFVLQKFVTGPQKSTTSIFFQIELNGLSSLGSNPLESLRRSIPGFARLNANKEPVPRTLDQYE